MLVRARLHTAAGAFATLLAMIPWKILEALGFAESQAAIAAGAFLALAALAALGAQHAPFAQRSFYVAWARETFEVSAFVRAFARYAIALLVLFTGLWFFATYAGR